MTNEITLDRAIEVVKDHIKIGREMVKLGEILPEGYIIPNCLQMVLDELERLQAENSMLKKALENRLNELESVQCKDETETYTTGYRNGHRNGQIELIRYVLCMPDGVKERADNEIAR